MTQSERYYDEFSHTYEDQRHRGYHKMLDELEVEVARRYMQGRVLEAGCGTGLVLERLRPHVDEVVGIDLSSGMLNHARGRQLRVAQATVEGLPFPDESFDGVTSFKVLAHVPGIQEAMAEMARVTRPGGHLVLEFYNRRSLRHLVKMLKSPSRIGKGYVDTDVFTRYDSLADIDAYLPDSLERIAIHGVRIITPVAQLHDLPFVGPLLARVERRLCESKWASHFGGFLIVVLRKRA
ncbi:MAG: methyltransferase domain-containing protein [Deltaproteobacteria bacterium]|nr:methyltransferase domain-containing protein [Deltaproteobacteria bacterium]